MKLIKLPAKPFKAAMHFMAKADVRYYLNGVHVNPEGYIEATNGHIAIRIECEEAKSCESMILRIDGCIPNQAETINISIDDDGEGYCHFTKITEEYVKSNSIRKTFGVLRIAGDFPDLKGLKDKQVPKAVSYIGFNADYIGVVGKAARALGARYPQVKATFNDVNGIILFDLNLLNYKAYAMVMPCAVGEDYEN